MDFRAAALALTFGVLVLLGACGRKEESAAPVEVSQSQNDIFDAAVEEMTNAYFYHVPEAATQLGISEETVPGTADRLMDRSVDGNTARWSIVCPTEGGPAMEGQWEFTSSGDSITGNGSMTASFNGQEMGFTMSWEGKRTGDCQ